jgi:hypothetical protein
MAALALLLNGMLPDWMIRCQLKCGAVMARCAPGHVLWDHAAEIERGPTKLAARTLFKS